MEEQRPARRSSGIYEAIFGSVQSFASNAKLRANAANPAGVSRTTAGGIPVRGAATQSNAVGGWDNQQPPAPVLPLAPAPQPFYKKRWFIISQIIIIPLGIALLFIILFPIVRAIVQLVVKRTHLDVTVAQISEPQNNTFKLDLQGVVTRTGIFSAKIEFTEPVNVSWIEDEKTETRLGVMTLRPLLAKNKRATINDTTQFNITDEVAFSRFAGVMITSESFKWRLQSKNLRVHALKFPLAKGISFDKELTMQSFNNFNGNVVLKDLQLPSDNPTGGINFIAVTQLTNPSPFGLNLGTVVFSLSYQGVPLGIGTGTDTRIIPGPENEISLRGTLVPQTDPASLAAVSQLFTNYLNGETSLVVAQGQSTFQTDGTVISWLSQGLQDLKLDVPFKAFTAIDPIKSITIGDLALQFDEDSPWTPTAESHSIQAALQLPFGFGLNIGEIKNDFNIVKDGNYVAGLATPLGASSSSISVLGPTDTLGMINISITDTRLTCPEPQHPAFAAFNAELTSSSVSEFRMIGSSRAVANTSLGQITLDPIKVNVSASLRGLQGLKGLATIQNVDVLGGTSSGIVLGINVTIANPSNLLLTTGDLTLQLLRGDVMLGTVLIPNLTLAMGNNSVSAKSSFAANDSPEGLRTLDDFVGGKDVPLSIVGFDGSTEVASLVDAFKTLNIEVILPGLAANLLESAALEVLSTTGTNNISHVTVSLANPFSAPLGITRIASTVSSFGILLGRIDSTAKFTSAPKSTTQSPSLDLVMNFDPASLFTVTRALAIEAGLDVSPLDAIVELGGIQYLTTSGGSSATRRQSDIFSGFDLPSFVQRAFKHLKSDVQLTTDATIGDYKTTLRYIQNTVPTVTDESLDFILPTLAQPIVQKIVEASVLGIESVLIRDPRQNSFVTQLKGSISNAGPFDATIAFPSGLNITWADKSIGIIKMANVHVVADLGATLNAESTFEVTDIAHLTEFTKTLLTGESFEWDVSGQNLSVTALGITVPGVVFSSRKVSFKGFNGLKDGVKILSFDLPSNDPAGGIHLTLEATASNPSQVGIELSSLGFNTFVGDVMIAPVASAGSVLLAPGSTSPISLVGRLVPQDSVSGLATISGIFNNFIHGQKSDVIVQGASAGSSDVTWLNEGIKALRIAAALPNQGPINVIQSIKINDMQMMFTPGTAYNPVTSSKSTDAAFALPFGFPIDITALEQTITAGFGGVDFAKLTIPRGPSTTDVGARVIHFSFTDVPFAVFDGSHSTFDQFVAATTVGGTQTLRLSGSANADALTAVGLVSLSDIDFAIDSNIDGLQGLNARPVAVTNMDVNHGYPDFLLIKIGSTIFNPSNLTIGTGDVSFNLKFMDQAIGTADLSDLTILPGSVNYPIDVQFAPEGGAVTAGRTLLQNFLQGINAGTSISGTPGSTSVNSLKSALSQIYLSPVTIPALNQTLIKSVSLTFPINIVQTGVASTSFVLANPFTASINLLKIGATAKFHGLTLGKINTIDASAHPVRAEGHGEVTSPALPFQFDLNPANIVKLLSLTSQEAGVDLGPLSSIFQFIVTNPDFKPPVITTVDTQAPTCVSGQQFDAATAILKSLASLKVDLDVESLVKLDDFATDLAFTQSSVPGQTDQTALFLISVVAGPVTQHLVDGSVLEFTAADISNISDDGFDLALNGSLTNVGPLDAVITFTEPVTVSWRGTNIAHIALDPICAAADAGVPNYQTKARLTITDSSAFTEFAVFLLHNPSFEWTITTSKLRVTALGTHFDNVSLSKVLTFKAFNGLPGVTISNFQLPSDDPQGGIHIETDALIPSPAQIGIDLGTVTFQSYFQGVLIGPLSGSGLFLQANAETRTHLGGRIVPQSDSDLDVIGALFSDFLAGQNLTLETKGDSVQPSGSSGPVAWLSTAFKTLTLEVILSGEKLAVIESIDLNDLTVTMLTAAQAFAPPTSSKLTLARYKNPFGFSLQVIEAGQTLILDSHGTSIAQLDLPKVPANGGVSTGNVVDLPISFQDQPLKVLNPTAFAQMLAGVTVQESVDLTLKGTADVTARTTIGDVPLTGIPIDVDSTLKGIASFGGQATLSNVAVTGSGGAGGSEYIVAPLVTTLQNPSEVSLDTVNVSLPVLYQGTKIGRATIDQFDLKPGRNDIQTEFRYAPDNANDTVAQTFLTNFIQTGDLLELVIHGDSSSSPFASLALALANLQLGTDLLGMNKATFITKVNVFLTLESLDTNLAEVDFDVQNPLDVELVIEHVQSDSGINGITYAQFSQSFSNFVVPAGGMANSGRIPNVVLTQGGSNSLGLIALGILDVFAACTVRIGQGGYRVPWLKMSQKSVPASYELVLG